MTFLMPTIHLGSLGRAIICLMFFSTYLFFVAPAHGAGIIADHTVSKESVLRSIPDTAIQAAKDNLHIAYFHSSHGSRVISGMTGLKSFRAGDDQLFDFTTQGTPGSGRLDIDDHHAGGNDLSAKDGVEANGYTQWFNETVAFLDAPENSDINVVMWSWCNPAGHDHEKYIEDMEALISRYGEGGTKIGTGPAHTKETPVVFVFMTGHPNGDGENPDETSAYHCHAIVKQHCENNNRYCLDYWDIETHGMEDTYYPHANDDGIDQGVSPSYEFYKAWQAGNPGDYFDNSCAHCSSDQELTCNRKAYAAWWLWAKIAGWEDTSEDETGDSGNQVDNRSEDEGNGSDRGTETGSDIGSTGCFLNMTAQ